MKRRLGWIAGGFGLIALVRGLARRHAPREEEPSIAFAPDPAAVEPERESQPEPEPEVDPRAEELRAKLQEAKDAGSDRDEFESGETAVDAAVPAVDLESRRRAVREDAQAAIDEMRGAGPGDSAA